MSPRRRLGLPQVGHDSSRRTVMNTLKNVLFFGLLLAVLCGVYLSLNRSPEPTLPPGLTGDTRKPKIEIGQADGPPLTMLVRPGNPAPSPFSAQPPPMSTPPADVGGHGPAVPATRPPIRTEHGAALSVRRRLGVHCRPRRLPAPPTGSRLPAGRARSVRTEIRWGRRTPTPPTAACRRRRPTIRRQPIWNASCSRSS